MVLAVATMTARLSQLALATIVVKWRAAVMRTTPVLSTTVKVTVSAPALRRAPAVALSSDAMVSKLTTLRDATSDRVYF
jgi:hypothetical protein